MKPLIRCLMVTAVLTQVACNGGSSNSNNSNSNDVVNDFSTLAQYSLSSCFNVEATQFSSTQYNLSAVVTLKNICDTPQALDGTMLKISSLQPAKLSSFWLNSVSPWSENNRAVFVDNVDGSETITVQSDRMVTSGATASVSVGGNHNLNTLVDSINWLATIQIPIPVTTGTITTTVDTRSLQNLCTKSHPCSIPLTLSGEDGSFESVIGTITPSNVGTTFTITSKGLNTADDYSISATGLPSGALVAIEPNQIVVTAKNASPSQVVFSADKNVLGSLSYTIATLPDLKLDDNSITMYMDNDLRNKSTFGTLTSLNNLSAGVHVLSSLHGYADALSGVYYNPYSTTINIAKNTVSNLGTINLTKNSLNPVSVVLNIQGLIGNDYVDLTLTDRDVQSGKSFGFIYNGIKNLKNGNTTLKLLPGDNVALNIAPSSSKYMQLNPISYTVKNAGGTLNITIKEAPSGAACLASVMSQSTYDSLLFAPNLAGAGEVTPSAGDPISTRKNNAPNSVNYYNYANLVAAYTKLAKNNPQYTNFLCSPKPLDNIREIAAILANATQETGGATPPSFNNDGSVITSYGQQGIAYALMATSEGNKTGAMDNPQYGTKTEYCNNTNALAKLSDCTNGYGQPYSNTYCRLAYNFCKTDPLPKEPIVYYGRGPKQLTYVYNYLFYGNAIDSVNPMYLAENPDILRTNGVLGWASSLAYWLVPFQDVWSTKPSMHDGLFGATVGSSYSDFNAESGFGKTVNIINGGVECGKSRTTIKLFTLTRIQAYIELLVRLGAPIDKVTVTMKNGTIYTYDANILDYNVHHNYSKKYRLANASIATSDYAGANKYNSFPFQEELNYAPNTTDVTNGATYYMTNVQNVVISYTNGQSEQLDCTGVTNWSGG